MTGTAPVRKTALILGSVLLALAVISLAWHTKTKTRPVPYPAIGSANPAGNLALHVFSPGAEDPNVAWLTTAYGVVLVRNRAEGTLFVLGDRARKTVREFSDYADFENTLGELPPGSELTIYDRCTVPLFYGFYPLQNEMHEKLKRDSTRKKLKLGTIARITCTCSNSRV